MKPNTTSQHSTNTTTTNTNNTTLNTTQNTNTGKYAEMLEAWREERGKARRYQAYMDGVARELHLRAQVRVDVCVWEEGLRA